MRIFVLTANYELRVSRKIHLRDHPSHIILILIVCAVQDQGGFLKEMKEYDSF
jgi:hypothetical protein